MKKRPAPQPERASPFFFQQLLESPTADVDISEAVTATLRDLYTPAGTAALLQTCVEEETSYTESLADLLETSWKRVEDVIARNKHRRNVVEEKLPQTLRELDACRFWTGDVAAARFHFPTPEEFGICTTKEEEEEDGVHTRVDMNSSKGLHAPESHVASLAAVPGKHRAKAWAMTGKDLLDPSKSPHCLRRLFAPILQRRQEYPKTLTLLLNAVQRVQSESFPDIEALIEKGYFHMPLHRLFRPIASYIGHYLAEDSRGKEPEAAFTETYKSLAKALKIAREKLREMGEKGGTLPPSSPSSSREGAAEVVYSTLLTELRERKIIHNDCSNTLQTITSDTSLQLDEIENGLRKCDDESRVALETLVENTQSYIEKLKEAIDRTKAAREDIRNEYKRDHDRIQSSLQSKLFQAKKSEDMQEKLARRIRETTKEWYLEQLKHERLMQEIMEESLALRQLDLSHNQLEELLEERIPTKESETKLLWVMDSLKKSEELRAQLVLQCSQHVDRLKTEEHYRRCRLVVYGTENALCWSRCLHDISVLYEKHYDTIAEKCNASMQLRYLLAYEKDLVVRDLHQLQREFSFLDTNWAKLVALLEELEMPVPHLAQCEKDEACVEFRRIMTELVSSRLICGDFARLVPVGVERQASPPLAATSDNAVATVGE